MLKKLFLFSLLILLLACAVGGVAFVWGYNQITRDLPDFSRVDDYSPPAVTEVFSRDGKLIAEFYKERRYIARLEEIPVFVRNCFLAAEDASFYNHPGINPMSIIRAFLKNLQANSARQGGSTITQQVVKNLLLSSEKTIERKVKEAILAYRIEERLTKDQILELYLNQIFFGNRAYGIKAAAKLYFNKDLDKLSLAEAALLAGLPKAPSRYSPIANFDLAKQRQGYVLEQMVRAGFLSVDAASAAKREEIDVFRASSKNIFEAPYFVTEVRKVMSERWPDLDIDRDGLRITTTLDSRANRFAQRALREGIREVDKRRGWRGPIDWISDANQKEFRSKYDSKLLIEPEVDSLYPALVTSVKAGKAQIDFGAFEADLDLTKATWAKKRINDEDKVTWRAPQSTIRRGDVVEVSFSKLPSKKEQESIPPGTLRNVVLDQTPQLEGALVALDPHTGKVVTTIGGYDYSRSSFNRATRAFRQPGSSFKPVVYLAAIDGYRYTPSTIVYDEAREFRVGDDVWKPLNYDKKFLGGITLRRALERSRNLVSADITAGIGVDAVIRYARKLGVKSHLGRNLSLSLGSSEVTPLEMTRAYGVFPGHGVLFDSIYVTKIEDRQGNTIYDYENERLGKAEQAISQNSAFIMAHMMQGVVQYGTGWRIRELKRPAAGKTGTSNDQMDAWYIGYTPEWVCGVWVGFDLKKTIGDKETGGRVSSPIWLNFMNRFLEQVDQDNFQRLAEELKLESEQLGVPYEEPQPLQPAEFTVPDGVDPFLVDRETGLLVEQGGNGAFVEYFLKGTEPSRRVDEQGADSYLDSPEL